MGHKFYSGEQEVLRFDVDHDYRSKYPDFIKSIREHSKECTLEIPTATRISKFGLLPRKPSSPENYEYFIIRLCTPSEAGDGMKEIKMMIRRHDLYFVAYQNSKGKWFKFLNLEVGIQAIELTFNEQYKDMMSHTDKTKLQSIILGFQSLQQAILELSDAGTVYEVNAEHMVRLVIMIMESTRFEAVTEYILHNDGSGLPDLYVKLIHKWGSLSRKLLRVKDKEGYEFMVLSELKELIPNLESMENVLAMVRNCGETEKQTTVIHPKKEKEKQRSVPVRKGSSSTSSPGGKRTYAERQREVGDRNGQGDGPLLQVNNEKKPHSGS